MPPSKVLVLSSGLLSSPPRAHPMHWTMLQSVTSKGNVCALLSHVIVPSQPHVL